MSLRGADSKGVVMDIGRPNGSGLGDAQQVDERQQKEPVEHHGYGCRIGGLRRVEEVEEEPCTAWSGL